MLQIERLESRLMPATVTLINKVLTISAQVGDLRVETDAADTVTVSDTVTNQSFQQSKVNKVIVLDTLGDDTVFMLANAGVANYDVKFVGSSGVNVFLLEGHFKKDVTYLAGSEYDILDFVTAPVKINGDLKYTGGTGNNFIMFQNFDTTILGDVTVNVSQSAHTNFGVWDTDTGSTYRFHGKVKYVGGAGVDQVFFNTFDPGSVRLNKVCIDLGTSNPDNPDYVSVIGDVTWNSFVVTP